MIFAIVMNVKQQKKILLQRNSTDPLEDYRSPVVAAKTLLTTLVESRRKQTFIPILNFINSVLTQYATASDNMKDPRKKDGALCMIGVLANFTLSEVNQFFYTNLLI